MHLAVAFPEHIPEQFVLGLAALALRLACFWVDNPKVLLDELNPARYAHTPDIGQRRQEINLLEVPALGMVVMPANQFALVRVSLLLYRIVENQNRCFSATGQLLDVGLCITPQKFAVIIATGQ